jgi:hypothetical protein
MKHRWTTQELARQVDLAQPAKAVNLAILDRIKAFISCCRHSN